MVRQECLVRTDGARLGDLVELERIEIVLDVYRGLLEYNFSEERIRNGGRRGGLRGKLA